MNNWISVKDELPSTEACGVESVMVLVCTVDDIVTTAFMKDIKNSRSWTDAQRICEFDVTHWMPLPEPPDVE